VGETIHWVMPSPGRLQSYTQLQVYVVIFVTPQGALLTAPACLAQMSGTSGQ